MSLVLSRTFSLVSIHLLIAMREEPVRSFMSRIAFLTRARVAIVDNFDEKFSYFCIYARCDAREIQTVFFKNC